MPSPGRPGGSKCPLLLLLGSATDHNNLSFSINRFNLAMHKVTKNIERTLHGLLWARLKKATQKVITLCVIIPVITHRNIFKLICYHCYHGILCL